MISCHFKSMRRIPKENVVETEKKLTILPRPPWNYTPQKRDQQKCTTVVEKHHRNFNKSNPESQRPFQ